MIDIAQYQRNFVRLTKSQQNHQIQILDKMMMMATSDGNYDESAKLYSLKCWARAEYLNY